MYWTTRGGTPIKVEDGVVKIDANGLQPHLEAFMASILNELQRNDAELALQKALIERQFRLARLCATASDARGIPMAAPAEVIVEAPVASNVKPSISGLGVTASGDHRLGRF